MNLERAKKVGVIAAVVPWTLIVAGVYAVLKKNEIENPAKWIVIGSAAIVIPAVFYVNPIDFTNAKKPAKQ